MIGMTCWTVCNYGWEAKYIHWLATLQSDCCIIKILYCHSKLLRKKTDQNCSDSDNDECSDVDNYGSIFPTEYIVNVINAIEEQRCTIFEKAQTNIKKAQQDQAKGYNNCQTQGTPFEVGQKVLNGISLKATLKNEEPLCWSIQDGL